MILDKVKGSEERTFYVQKTIENGWSRSMLVLQVESRLYHRQGAAITNFQATLPAPQSDLAQQILKDPYSFDFLSLSGEFRERELERALVTHIRDFLLELGVGFAFVGSQVHLEVGARDFYLDLLFYHLHLRSYVVFELQSGEFEPEHMGKLNLYLSAVDDLLRHPDDKPSIGVLLCRGRDQVVVEYALRDMNKPIGVADWQLTRTLPADFSSSLPTVEELEAELESSAGNDTAPGKPGG